MNSKERAELRAAANKLEPVIYIGKDSDEFIKNVDICMSLRNDIERLSLRDFPKHCRSKAILFLYCRMSLLLYYKENICLGYL